MGRKRETSIHMREKKNPFTLLRKGFFFPRRWNTIAMAREHTRVLINLEHLVGDDGWQPFPDRHDVNGIPRPEQRRRWKLARGRRRGRMENLRQLKSKRKGGGRIAARAKGE